MIFNLFHVEHMGRGGTPPTTTSLRGGVLKCVKKQRDSSLTKFSEKFFPEFFLALIIGQFLKFFPEFFWF